ncbi:DUF1294 domain-containing protein [Roseibacillus ishigakijimensis]|uniref:DUF1294 domain-containing protein n=1 Tax=Roseibacillus ishigakijimensis TaxID=454146 RepID=A0A934RMS5_9BACT|nr:DUF1294 domain-containing protein [Roseibacillus ishigakijimensis]MBK1832527.1 DUF1294 domain-containing protein [Roseibacillus ishigakijimensis]
MKPKKSPSSQPSAPLDHKETNGQKSLRPLNGWGAFLVFALLLFLPAWLIVDICQRIDWRYPLAYLVLISILTVTFYLIDKRKARDNAWRIPEANLHLFEFLGGWPAALVTQRFLRHKTRKKRYQIVFWVIIISHQIIAFELLTGGRITRSLSEALKAA